MERAVFLDRDGVINEVNTRRVRFVNTVSDLYLLPRAAKAIYLLNAAGYKVFVITNQGGIGLGFMKLETLLRIHIELVHRLSRAGAYLDDIAYCPHKPGSGCACRKPKPGMILELARKYFIDLGESYTIGDMDTDIKAGAAAGTKTIQIISGSRPSTSIKKGSDTQADYQTSSLWKAVQWILEAQPNNQN